MKIALVLGKRFSDVNFSDVTHTLELADRLEKAGADVTVLTIESDTPEGYLFSTEGILDPDYQTTNWEKSENIHAWLLGNPQDVVYASSRDAPLLVEQTVGATPTIVRPALNLLDSVAAGNFDGKRHVPEIYKCTTSRQHAWSVHMAESASVRNASLVVGHGSNFELQAKSVGNPRTRQLPMPVQGVDSPTKGEGILIMAGRYTYLKGADLLPDIVNAIPENIPVSLVGGQLWMDDSFTREVEIPDGYLDRSDLYQRYQNCAAVLIPARITGFSLTTLEAFSFGTPVICFDPTDPVKQSWPLWRMGHPQVGGFRALPEILKLLDTEEEAAAKYRESLCEFARQFTWDKLMQNYTQAFEAAVANAVTQGSSNRSW